MRYVSKYSQCENLKTGNCLSLLPTKRAGYSCFCSVELTEGEEEGWEWSKTMDIQQTLALETIISHVKSVQRDLHFRGDLYHQIPY